SGYWISCAASRPSTNAPHLHSGTARPISSCRCSSVLSYWKAYSAKRIDCSRSSRVSRRISAFVLRFSTISSCLSPVQNGAARSPQLETFPAPVGKKAVLSSWWMFPFYQIAEVREVRKTWLTLLCIALAVSLLPAVSSASGTGSGDVPSVIEVVKAVNFREGPSTDAKIIRLLKAGERLSVRSQPNTYWFEAVDKNGKT